ncbi:hypothetical protein GW916_08215 [bacterium]|nr:hypothetical protein [bacterium]
MTFREWFDTNVKSRWFKKQLSISVKPTFVLQYFGRDVLICTGIIALAFLLGLFTRTLFISDSKNPQSDEFQEEEQGSLSTGPVQEGLLVLSFAGNGLGPKETKGTLVAHEGTLVRVRLQNSLETYESVPAFAQIIDHTLGIKYFGATLIGTASGDGTVSRIKMSFTTLKPKHPSQAPFEFEGQALSLDGTLGIKAAKAENLMNRSLFRGGSNLLGSKPNDAHFEAHGLAGLLARALVKGLQEEGGSDLGTINNRASVLTLQAGAEFYVQLTQSIFGGSK